MLDDVASLREGQVLWGWPHCVQDRELTQAAVDRRLTLIAFEAMNHWNDDGSFGLHVFHKNNELAGYCSVLHALQIAGLTGDYGRRLRAVVIGFGATARGAVTALNALGVRDVDVLTNRAVAAVASPIPSVRIVHFDNEENIAHVSQAVTDEGEVALAEFLGEHDIIVNCVLQDPNAPLMFLTDDDLDHIARAPWSSTSPATRAWASAGPGPRRSSIRPSSSAIRCSTTPSTTARPTSGTPRPGRSARP